MLHLITCHGRIMLHLAELLLELLLRKFLLAFTKYSFVEEIDKNANTIWLIETNKKQLYMLSYFT